MSDEHKGHRVRLKERFLQNGIESFAHHEILELLLFFAIPREDTNPIAHNLLDSFGSLSGDFEASYKDLQRVAGVGASAATLLKIIPHMAMCYHDDKNKIGVVLD